jgi:uncharacterized membrane protein
MGKNRLEAFSDGVIAIIITIMVLELRVPHGGELSDLRMVAPVFASYVLSFVYIGIYWSNHHHLFHAVHRVDGGMLWANLHLLFWLSLIPFSTAWMGENHFTRWPAAVYGINLLLCALAYTILVRRIIYTSGRDSLVARAIGSDRKGNLSLLLYVIAVSSAFVVEWVAFALYVTVALIWLVPDRRIARAIEHHPGATRSD